MSVIILLVKYCVTPKYRKWDNRWLYIPVHFITSLDTFDLPFIMFLITGKNNAKIVYVCFQMQLHL